MTHRSKNLLVLGASALASIALAEVGSRIVLDEVNYLRPSLVAHPVLRHAVVPGSAGHDRWGFRNVRVPERADVLAIGDSDTYGYSAPAAQAWPAWLGRLTGRSVYNMGLGGYGPPDYQHLLELYGDSLSPRAVVIGFYLGNDVRSAYRDAIGVREVSVTLHPPPDRRVLGDVRTWLSRNSVLYQAAKHHGALLVDVLRFRESSSYAIAGQFPLDHPVARTVFAPRDQLVRLDQTDERNRVGVGRMLEIMEAIEAWCGTRQVRCLFLLIPTKESVYWDIARTALGPRGRAMVAEVVRWETDVRDQIIAFFTHRDMAFVDPLPRMQRAAHRERLFPASIDGHPNGAGYRTIAESVAEKLKAGAPSRLESTALASPVDVVQEGAQRAEVPPVERQ